MMTRWQLHHGKCSAVLPTLPDNSVDAVVTDPPYELGFMGKKWDGSGVAYDQRVWSEALRVLKPGGYLLSFGGTRTYHRMACAIEDSGFTIRDCLQWLYGQGFPKSLDISKALDKANGRQFEDRYALGQHIRKCRKAFGFSRAEINSWLGAATKAEHYESDSPDFARIPTLADWAILQPRLGLSLEYLPLVERVEAERAVIGRRTSGLGTGRGTVAIMGDTDNRDVTAPATELARQWDGYGTALKPACEPIVLAQKPLDGTYAANVAKWGVGGLNIGASRIAHGADVDLTRQQRQTADTAGMNGLGESGYKATHQQATYNDSGRWPANVILDAWDEQVLRLRYNTPDEVSTVIREYFDGYSRLPAMPKAYRGAAKSRQANEVLFASVLRGVVEPESQRHESSHVRQETHGGIARQDDGAKTGDGEEWAGNHKLEGGQTHVAGLRDDRCFDSLARGADAVRFDDESQQAEGDTGTSPRDGACAGARPGALGDSPSQERDQERQPFGESGNQGQRRSQEGALAGAPGVAATSGRERTAVSPTLYVLECDLPHGWLRYFEPTGITLPSPDSAGALLDAQSGERKAGGYVSGLQASHTGQNGIYSPYGRVENAPYGDTGGASRFFYCAKASRSERDAGLSDLPLVSGAEITDSKEGSARLDSPRTGAGRTSGGRNTHPTVKPIALMRWLVRLVTPEGGTVLDPFAGSGTTLCAAIHEGRSVIGIEMTEDYLPLIRGRATHAEREVAQRAQQSVLPLGV